MGDHGSGIEADGSRTFAALDCVWPASPSDDDVDRLIAFVDDFEPTAVEPITGGVRIFFPSAPQQAAAHAHLAASAPPLTLTSVLVPDEHWAERSQASLASIRVGRVVISPPWRVDDPDVAPGPSDILITVLPSMGFGTGHHASTRLCLGLMQRQPVEGERVLDVGTGSGVLAVAAWRLGAASVVAIDSDRDAIEAAADTRARNGATSIELRVVDVTHTRPTAEWDLLIANITGAMLARFASRLVADVRPGGSLIVSGFQTIEREAVRSAFAEAGASLVEDLVEDDWCGLRLRRTASAGPTTPTAR